jgi:hypothetical protein
VPSDEARPFEGQHHLVNRGRADAEAFLHVGFGRRPAVQPHVQLDKRQSHHGHCSSVRGAQGLPR